MRVIISIVCLAAATILLFGTHSQLAHIPKVAAIDCPYLVENPFAATKYLWENKEKAYAADPIDALHCPLSPWYYVQKQLAAMLIAIGYGALYWPFIISRYKRFFRSTHIVTRGVYSTLVLLLYVFSTGILLIGAISIPFAYEGF